MNELNKIKEDISAIEKCGLETIPLVAHEMSEQRHKERETQMERHHNVTIVSIVGSLSLVIVLLIILLFVSNALWLSYVDNFNVVTYTQDGQGTNNIEGNNINSDMKGGD